MVDQNVLWENLFNCGTKMCNLLCRQCGMEAKIAINSSRLEAFMTNTLKIPLSLKLQ